MADSPSGQTVMAGRYRVTRSPASGSWVTAWDSRLRRWIALKRMGPRSPDRRARFLEEARIIARLDHPGIVPVHELGCAPGDEPFYTTRDVQGLTLEEVLRRGETPRPALLRMFEQICQAVAFAHLRDVVHCDLKPASVLVGRWGEVQVLHWDLSCKWRGQASASDICGLGRILKQILGGDFPRTARDTELEAIASRALDREGTRRYTSVAELLADVQAYLDGRMVGAARYGFVARCRKWLSRHPYLVRGAAAVATTALLFGGFLQLDASRRRASYRQAVVHARTALDATAPSLRIAAVQEAVRALPPDPTQRLSPDASARAQYHDLVRQLAEIATRARHLVRLQPGDAPAARTLLDALDALGRVSEAAEEYALADQAYAEAAALGAEGSRYRRLIAGLAGAEGAALARSQKRVLRLLAAAGSGLLEGDEAYRAAVIEIASHPGRQTVELLLARLDELTAVVSRTRPGQPTGAEGRRLARQIGLVAEALGLLADSRGTVESLSRYLRVEPDQIRAVPAGVALARLSLADPGAERALLARVGLAKASHPPRAFWGVAGPFWRQVTRELGVLRARTPAQARAPWTEPEPTTALGYHTRGLVREARGQLAGAIGDYTRAIELDPARSGAAYLNRGLARERVGDLTGAMDDYTRAMAVEPGQAAPYRSRGRARQAQGDLEGALADFSRAIELDPKSALAYLRRGSTRHAKRDLKGAIADYSRSLELNPRDELALANRGQARKDTGDLDGAIADCTRAIELNPGFWVSHNNRGLARKAKGDLDGAIADFTRAIQLDPNAALAFDNRGDARLKNGDLEGAIADTTRALQLAPKLASAYHHRAAARAAQGDREGAVADYTQAIALDPKEASAYRDRGTTLLARGDVAGAIADYSRAIRLDPTHAGAYSGRGMARRKNGDLSGALADLTRAIELDPRSSHSYDARGTTRRARGDLEGAIADYTHAIQLDPKSPVGYSNRGGARAARGDLDGAIADYTRGIELDPRLAANWANRGNARAKKADHLGAIADYTQAIQLDPRLWQAWANLGFLRAYLGHRKEAIAALRRAHDLAPAKERLPISAMLARLEGGNR